MDDAQGWRLELALFGGLEVRHDGRIVEGFQGRKLQSLLGFLVLHRRTACARSRLAHELWPDVSEEQGLRSLRRLLHDLRRRLPEADRCILADRTFIRWRPDAPCTIDVDTFEALAARPTDLSTIHRAVALYRGELLPICSGAWIEPIRARLARTYHRVLEVGVDLAEQARDYRAAVELAERCLGVDAAQEDMYRRLMHLHALLGEPARVREVYDRCRETLQIELGVRPSEETEALFRRLSVSRRVSGEVQGRRRRIPLVGRHREWGVLRSRWQDAVAGMSGLCLVSGDAGIGKTRLAEELVERVRSLGYRVLSGRCYEPEQRLTFGVAVQLVRECRECDLPAEVRGLLGPTLHQADAPADPVPSFRSGGWTRPALFDALTRLALARGPVLVFVDDIQWCDNDSLEWLHHLLQRARGRKLLVLATLRRHDMADEGLLHDVLRSLSRDGLVDELDLMPLSPDETAELVTSLHGDRLPDQVTRRVFRETEGSPLFVVELVNAGLLRGERWSPDRLPGSIRAVFQGRLATLPPGTRELAGLASVFGRDWTVDALHQASARDLEAVLEDLELLVRRRVLTERRDGRYDFTHGKLREYTYAQIGRARRRLWHRRIAEALSRSDHEEPGVHAQVAFHLDEAGDRRGAARHHLLAGDEAMRVYALEEAERAYRRAVEAFAPGEVEETLWRAWCGLERVHELAARRGAQGEDLERLEALAEAAGNDAWRAEVCNRRSQLCYEVGLLDEAAAHARKAAHLAHRAGLPGAEARALYHLGKIQNHVGHDHGPALAAHRKAYDLARHAGERALAQRILRAIIFSHAALGQHQRALAAIDEAIESARVREDRREQGYLRMERARTFGRLGQYRRAIEELERIVPLARSVGDPKLETLIAGFLGMAAQEVRAFDRARDHLERAIVLSRKTGDRIGESLWLSCTGLVLGLVGHLDRAVARIEEAIRVVEQVSGRGVLTTHLSYLVRLDLEFERPESALVRIERCREVLVHHPDPVIETRVRFYEGWAALLSGQVDEAIRRLETALQALNREGPDEEAQSCVVLLAMACVETGDLARARSLLEPLLARYRRDPEVAVPQRAFLAGACLAWAGGDEAGARAHLDLARALVHETARNLGQHRDRDVYLSAVPVNRRILLWARAGRPVGRPTRG